MISDKTNWENWINSSGKDDPPPDFYSDKYRIMMDVMRVDDHERTGNRGKLFNPVRQRERMLHKEITDKFGISPDSKVEIHINAYTGLSSYEDHNYTLYKNNFRRVIKNILIVFRYIKRIILATKLFSLYLMNLKPIINLMSILIRRGSDSQDRFFKENHIFSTWTLHF